MKKTNAKKDRPSKKTTKKPSVKSTVQMVNSDRVIVFDEIQVIKKYHTLKLQSEIQKIYHTAATLKGDARKRFLHERLTKTSAEADMIPDENRLKQQQIYIGPNIVPPVHYMYRSKSGKVYPVSKLGLKPYEECVANARLKIERMLEVLRLLRTDVESHEASATRATISAIDEHATTTSSRTGMLQVAESDGPADIVRIFMAAKEAGIITNDLTVELICQYFFRDSASKSFRNTVTQELRRRRASKHENILRTSRSPNFEKFLQECLTMLERSALDRLSYAIDKELQKRP